MTMMKQRLRRANQERHQALVADDADDDDDDDEKGVRVTPDVTTTDDSFSSSQTTPNESSSSPEKQSSARPSNDSVATSSASSSSQFPRTFSLEFPLDPFQSMPETPLAQLPKKEPVWKRRLKQKAPLLSEGQTTTGTGARAGGASPSPNPTRVKRERPRGVYPVTPVSLLPKGREYEEQPESEEPPTQTANKTLEEYQEEEEAAVVVVPQKQEEEENEEEEDQQEYHDEAEIEEASPKTDEPNEHEEKAGKSKIAKTVSFDETGLKAPENITRKKQTSRRKHDEKLSAFEEEEESFDALMRSNSSYSDIFTNIFDDEDFSIATPTIYTDGTDDSTTLSSHSRRKSKDRKERKSSKKKSRSRSRRNDHDDESEDDFEYDPMGCRTTAVLEEFKMFTDLFSPANSCSCSKIEDGKASRRPRRPKDRRGTKSSSRRSRSED